MLATEPSLLVKATPAATNGRLECTQWTAVPRRFGAAGCGADATWKWDGLGHEEFDEFLALMSRALSTSEDPDSWLLH
jgi:hypothetical protein